MRPYISFSQINLYSQCGIKYALRYVEGILLPPSTPLLLGSAFHKAQEVYYKSKMAGQELSLSSIKDAFSSEIDETVKLNAEILLTEEERQANVDVVEDVRCAGFSMIEAYYNNIGVNTKPLEVEQQFTLNLGEAIPPVIGYIDLITEEGTVVDTKTSKKAPAKGAAEQSIQLTIYRIGFETLYGYTPEKLRLDYVYLNKEGGKTTTLETKRGDADRVRLLKRIRRVVEGIYKGVFIPPEQGSWACSYCGYKQLGICDEY